MARSNLNDKRKYEKYKSEHIREKNKIRKLKKLQKTHPNNLVLQQIIDKNQAILDRK